MSTSLFSPFLNVFKMPVILSTLLRVLKMPGSSDNALNSKSYDKNILFYKSKIKDYTKLYSKLTEKDIDDVKFANAIKKSEYKPGENMSNREIINEVFKFLKNFHSQISQYALDINFYELSIEHSIELIENYKYKFISTLFCEVMTKTNCFIKVKRKHPFHNEIKTVQKFELKHTEYNFDLIIDTSNYIKGFYDMHLTKFDIDNQFYLNIITIFLIQKKRVDKYILLAILKTGYEFLLEHENVVNIDTTKDVIIFGDTHGQFFDTFGALIGIEGNGFCFEEGFRLNTNKLFLFNGDFVDRGQYSIENYIFLLLLKILYPENVYLNRGNHEFYADNGIDFLNEIKKKYGIIKGEIVSDFYLQEFENIFEIYEIFTAFNLTFSVLPLASIINKIVFVVHGGLPKGNCSIDQINNLDRRTNLCDKNLIINGLMWSDPIESDESKENPRMAGICFGYNDLKSFFFENGIQYMIRSHQHVDGGVRYNHNGTVITVFSAPNYCGIENIAAYLILKTNQPIENIENSKNLSFSSKTINEWSDKNINDLKGYNLIQSNLLS
ncbi:hypothetical protein GVAV_001516 [Gurleya vavrai]